MSGKGTQRRDQLREIEVWAQKKWAEEKTFEVDAPEHGDNTKEPKFMVTFPYPYMNGRLHLGHAFSLTKSEFAVAYERMNGKRALWGFGFHCTGSPILAAANRLKRELDGGDAAAATATATKEAAAPAEKEAGGNFKGKKTKALQKKGAGGQGNILLACGVDPAEVPEFTESMKWLQYFPPRGKDDLIKMGVHVDWRRSFITTDVNPFYDRFIRWQFNTLKAAGKIKFGKRNSVYSPLDGQPCGDHDRRSGEGVQAQEYVLIKMKVVTELTGALAPLAGRNVFLPAATLRPETMYGQTNYFVLPEGEYGAYEVVNDEVFICSAHAARNLAHQDLTPEFGVANKLLSLTGADLIGVGVKSPNAQYDVVYGLPMLTIKMNKGTGIVTSVPSDAPDDWRALQDLKEKDKLRAKFGVLDEHVLPFEAIPIIEIDGVTCAAVKACKDMKIASQNDRDKLAKAKEMVYMRGFYEGKMVVGEYAGAKVQDAKEKIKAEMVAAGHAALYSEPESEVISRSGDVCVVALTDQWYLCYGEEEWQAKTKLALSRMELYHDETRVMFDRCLEWLNEWACSRTFGLGTRLPWDTEWVIESLSDSTIYMAYYTFAHILQNGVLDGTEGNPAGIQPEHLTDAVLDHILLGKDKPADCAIPDDTLALMCREFNYWYPHDLRVSGKDLINNHLTFSLYNHTAIFPEKHWPAAYRTNGHVLVDSEKMSKSLGNFVTLSDAVDLYSADAMRVALADAGDGMDDANFVRETANQAILRLTKELTWIKEMLAARDSMRTESNGFVDAVFESELNSCVAKTKAAYDRYLFREALQHGYYAMAIARDAYRTIVGVDNMRGDLVMRYIETLTLMMQPIAPHWAEYVWTELLKKGASIMTESFPVPGAIDAVALRKMEFLRDLAADFRSSKNKKKKKKGKKGKKGAPAAEPAEPEAEPDTLHVIVAPSYAEWQENVLDLLQSQYVDGKFVADSKTMAKLIKEKTPDKKTMQKAMGFAKWVQGEVARRGPEAMNKKPLDEKALLESEAAWFAVSVGLAKIQVVLVDDESVPANMRDRVMPGKPIVSAVKTE